MLLYCACARTCTHEHASASSFLDSVFPILGDVVVLELPSCSAVSRLTTLIIGQVSSSLVCFHLSSIIESELIQNRSLVSPVKSGASLRSTYCCFSHCAVSTSRFTWWKCYLKQAKIKAASLENKHIQRDTFHKGVRSPKYTTLPTVPRD